jgi:hypothetical protein
VTVHVTLAAFVGSSPAVDRGTVGTVVVERVRLAGEVAVAGARPASLLRPVRDRVVVDEVEADRPCRSVLR